MSRLKLSIAVGDFDRVRSLIDGDVQIDGVEPVFLRLAPEEIFFRGYMQSWLREHWSARASVLAASLAFALLHVDTSFVHTTIAFALGLYLGWVVETTGSTLPAITCQIVNNIVYTLQIALGLGPQARDANLIAAPIAAAVFVGCVLWVRRAARDAPPLPPMDAP